MVPSLIPLSIALLAFLCPVGGASLSMALRRRLPAHHLNGQSIDLIRLATGLMASLVALVLGLLMTAASGTHGIVEKEYRLALSKIAHLDQYLDAYGPETRDIREDLKRGVVARLQSRWPNQDFGPKLMVPPGGVLVPIERHLVALKPTDDGQGWFRAQALQLAHDVTQLHELVLAQEVSIAQQLTGTLPLPIMIVVIVLSTAIFGSFGLFVEPNLTVVTALVVAALTMATFVFVIVELHTPFSGLLQVSTAPAHALVGLLGK